MTKKDFVALAAAINSQRESMASARTEADRLTVATVNLTVDLIAGAVADVCQGTNPRFNRSRFLDACGYVS